MAEWLPEIAVAKTAVVAAVKTVVEGTAAEEGDVVAVAAGANTGTTGHRRACHRLRTSTTLGQVVPCRQRQWRSLVQPGSIQAGQTRPAARSQPLISTGTTNNSTPVLTTSTLRTSSNTSSSSLCSRTSTLALPPCLGWVSASHHSRPDTVKTVVTRAANGATTGRGSLACMSRIGTMARRGRKYILALLLDVSLPAVHSNAPEFDVEFDSHVATLSSRVLAFVSGTKKFLLFGARPCRFCWPQFLKSGIVARASSLVLCCSTFVLTSLSYTTLC